MESRKKGRECCFVFHPPFFWKREGIPWKDEGNIFHPSRSAHAKSCNHLKSKPNSVLKNSSGWWGWRGCLSLDGRLWSVFASTVSPSPHSTMGCSDWKQIDPIRPAARHWRVTGITKRVKNYIINHRDAFHAVKTWMLWIMVTSRFSWIWIPVTIMTFAPSVPHIKNSCLAWLDFKCTFFRYKNFGESFFSTARIVKCFRTKDYEKWRACVGE